MHDSFAHRCHGQNEKRLLGIDLSKYIQGAPEGNVLPINIQVFSDGDKKTGLYIPIPVGQENSELSLQSGLL